MLRRLLELLEAPEQVQEEPPEYRVQEATCVILLEVARADNEFSDDERRHIVQTLQSYFQLSNEEATELVAVATDTRRESLDLWQFTNAINQTCSHEEKTRILEEVWRVVFADGTIDGHEDHLARRLAKLLNLHHKEFIDAKVKVRAERAEQGLE